MLSFAAFLPAFEKRLAPAEIRQESMLLCWRYRRWWPAQTLLAVSDFPPVLGKLELALSGAMDSARFRATQSIHKPEQVASNDSMTFSVN